MSDPGNGSYEDPITLATATNNNNLPKCGIVYIPQLRKYFRNEDDCEQCSKSCIPAPNHFRQPCQLIPLPFLSSDTDWTNGGQYHVDLWTGSNQQDDGTPLTNCENSLNAGSTIVVNAPNSLPTDSKLISSPLYILPYLHPPLFLFSFTIPRSSLSLKTKCSHDPDH